MTYDRIDLRRTKSGPVVAILFGATIENTSISAEIVLIPEPIKRSIRVRFETFQIQIPKVLSPDLFGPAFGSDCPQFEVI
jgi:hypothetical protein